LKKRNHSGWTKAGWLLFYLYIVLLSYFLFFSEHYGRDGTSQDYRYNLILFKEIKRFIQYRHILGLESFVVNIMGNVLAFAPFGFLLPMLNKRYRGFFITAFLSFIFTLAVELVQLYFKVGIFDVDDIFLNTVGGVLGYISYRIFHTLFLKSGKKNQKSRRS
jgi:glycopeptide antibiotics resistance protein